MTQKNTTFTPEESAIANRDLKSGKPAAGTAAPKASTAPVAKPDPAAAAGHKTHAGAKPGEPNISEDDRLKNAGSPYKDVNFGNRSSMDE